jgi:hypothetical protein
MLLSVLLAEELQARAPRVTRSQVGAHLWPNTSRNKPLPRLLRQPLVYRMVASVRGGSKQRKLQQIDETLINIERLARVPITRLTGAELRANLTLFRSEKARLIAAYDHDPNDITEGFIEVDVSHVYGHEISGRRIFYQRFRPRGRASGKVFVVSPGFQETGRNFYDQIDELCKLGHEVIAMDHTWAGYTTDLDGRRNPGGFERGFAVARDVAAVAAFAKHLADNLYGAGDNLVLMGNSMGAGPGVLGAILLSNAGQMNIRLRGYAEGFFLGGLEAPRSVHGLLQSPFLRATPSVTNRTIAILARVPVLKRLRFPAVGVPPLTRDAQAQTAFAGHAARENVRVQFASMVAAEKDLQHILELARAGTTGSRFVIVHGDKDTLADAKATRELFDAFRANGTSVEISSINTSDHILEEHSTHKKAFLGMLETLVQ